MEMPRILDFGLRILDFGKGPHQQSKFRNPKSKIRPCRPSPSTLTSVAPGGIIAPAPSVAP